MKTDLVERREHLKEKLIFLKREMVKFFNCSNENIKFSEPAYIDDKCKVNVSFTMVNMEKSSLKRFVSSTYYFDFEDEYIKREGILYEGNFYSYEELNDFFSKVSSEMEKMKYIITKN